MKSSVVLLFGFWPIVLLLMCLSGVTAHQDAPSLAQRKDMHGDQPDARSDDDGYGVPPPYFTVHSTASTGIAEPTSDLEAPKSTQQNSVSTSSVTEKIGNDNTSGTHISGTEATSSSDDSTSTAGTGGNVTHSQAEQPPAFTLPSGSPPWAWSSNEGEIFNPPGISQTSSVLMTELSSPSLSLTIGDLTSSASSNSPVTEATVFSEITVTLIKSSWINQTVTKTSSETYSSAQTWNSDSIYTRHANTTASLVTRESSGAVDHSITFVSSQGSTSSSVPGTSSVLVSAESNSVSSNAQTGNSIAKGGEPTGPLPPKFTPPRGLTSHKGGLTVPGTISAVSVSQNPNEWSAWPTSDLDQTPSLTAIAPSDMGSSSVGTTARLSVSALSNMPNLPDPVIPSSWFGSSASLNFSWSWSETMTKTLSPVLTSVLSKTSTSSNLMNETLGFSKASTESAETSQGSTPSSPTTSIQSAINSTRPSGLRSLTVVTLTGGTVVTVYLGGTSYTQTTAKGFTESFNVSTRPTLASSINITVTGPSRSGGLIPFTSDWSTATLEETPASTGIPSNKTSSLSNETSRFPLTTKLSSVASAWTATTTIDLTKIMGGQNATTTEKSTTTSLYSNDTTASVISISISRNMSMTQFPFPTNASPIWGTKAGSVLSGSETTTPTLSGFLTSSMSGKGMAVSPSRGVDITSWPTPPASASKGLNSTTEPYWTMNSTSGMIPAWNTSLTRSPLSLSLDPSSWSTFTIPAPPFPVPPSLDPTWTTIPESLTADLTIPGSKVSALETVVPPFPMPSNSTVSPSVTGTGHPLPFPLPTFGSVTAGAWSSAHTLSSSLTGGYKFSNSSSMAVLSTLVSNPISGTAKPPFSTSNSSALTISRGYGVSSSNGEDISTTTIVITRSHWISLNMTTTPGGLALTNTPQATWSNSTLSLTAGIGGSFTTTLSTEFGAMQTSGASAPPLSINTSFSIWANSTSGLSGPSGAADAPGSVTPPGSPTSMATSLSAKADSSLSGSARSTSPLPPWVSQGSSTAGGRSSLAPFPTRNSTISEQSSHVGAQATSTDGVAATWIPTWNTTATCSDAANSTGLCTSDETPSQSPIDSSITGQTAHFSTSNCTHTYSGTVPLQPLTPFIPIPITSKCVSSSTTSTCTTFRWTSNGNTTTTGSVAFNTLNAHASPTTLETVTRVNKVSDGKPKHPAPADTATIAHHGMPEGGESSAHRSPDATRFGDGMGGDVLPDRFVRRWEQVVSTLKGLWRGDDLGVNGQFSGLE